MVRCLEDSDGSFEYGDYLIYLDAKTRLWKARKIRNVKGFNNPKLPKEFLSDKEAKEHIDMLKKDLELNVHSKEVKDKETEKPKFEISENNVLLRYNGKEKNVIIPQGVTSISRSAFVGNQITETIKIPNTVTRIEANAFACAFSLKGIEIPDSVTYLGEAAFFVCSNLTEVKLSNSISKIYGLSFAGTKLVNVNIPENVKYISKDAFNCKTLENVIIENPNIEICKDEFVFSMSGFSKPKIISFEYSENLFSWCDDFDYEYLVITD